MNQSAIECSYITSLNENNIIFYIKEKKLNFMFYHPMIDTRLPMDEVLLHFSASFTFINQIGD